jgi:hypothetical protein
MISVAAGDAQDIPLFIVQLGSRQSSSNCDWNNLDAIEFQYTESKSKQPHSEYALRFVYRRMRSRR